MPNAKEDVEIPYSPMLADLRYAFRQILRNPGFAAVVVVSLAVGIGANTAIFGLVDDLILNSLPVRAPHELILFEWLPGALGSRPLHSRGSTFGDDDTDPATGRPLKRIFSVQSFEELRRDNSLLSETFAFAWLGDATLNIDNTSETVGSGQLVSGNYTIRRLVLEPIKDARLRPKMTNQGLRQ